MKGRNVTDSVLGLTFDLLGQGWSGDWDEKSQTNSDWSGIMMMLNWDKDVGYSSNSFFTL